MHHIEKVSMKAKDLNEMYILYTTYKFFMMIRMLKTDKFLYVIHLN